MSQLATFGARSQSVRNKAVELTQGLLQKDFKSEACNCLSYVRDKIRYVRDPANAEMLHYADYVLSIGAGDCDDKAILLAALLNSIGHQVQFIAMSQQPNRYCHVWVQDWIDGKWLDLEPTEPIPCGSRVPSKGVLGYLTQEV